MSGRDLNSSVWANDHHRLGEISRRYHVAIAAKIDADRELLEVPRENIARWTRVWGLTQPDPAYAEWLELLDTLDWPQLRELLVADTEEGQRLRSSTPFVGILTQAERLEIYHGVPR